MSQWTHLICFSCWSKRMEREGTPDRKPIALKEEGEKEGTCCFCGSLTASRIYVRHDPKLLENCKHDDPKEEPIAVTGVHEIKAEQFLKAFVPAPPEVDIDDPSEP